MTLTDTFNFCFILFWCSCCNFTGVIDYNLIKDFTLNLHYSRVFDRRVQMVLYSVSAELLCQCQMSPLLKGRSSETG